MLFSQAYNPLLERFSITLSDSPCFCFAPPNCALCADLRTIFVRLRFFMLSGECQSLIKLDRFSSLRGGGEALGILPPQLITTFIYIVGIVYKETGAASVGN